METSIDKFGRIVIPRLIRKRLGLESGSRVEIRADDNRVQIRPVMEEPALTSVDGRLVHNGSLPADVDFGSLIELERDQRAARLSGLDTP